MALYQVNAGDRILAADINQFYSILKGVAASGEAVTLIYNAAGSLILQPSSDPATGTELIQVKNAASTVQAAFSSDGKFYAADGIVGTPGITFEADKDTGLYRSAANTIDLAAGGTQAAEFTATVANFKDGAVGGPGVSFISDPDTGVYRIGANTLGLAAGAAEIARVDATGLSLDGGTTYVDLWLNRWRWFYQSETVPNDSAVTGSGIVPTLITGANWRRWETGGTSGGTSANRTKLRNTSAMTVGKLRRLEIQCDFVHIDANTSSYIFITNENVATVPSVTAMHIGLKNIAGVVSFTTADGATEQTTAITAFVSASTDYTFVVTFDGTTAKLYIDGVLRATHATNVPTATMNSVPVWRSFIINSAAATKMLDIDHIEAIFATA